MEIMRSICLFLMKGDCDIDLKDVFFPHYCLPKFSTVILFPFVAVPVSDTPILAWLRFWSFLSGLLAVFMSI